MKLLIKVTKAGKSLTFGLICEERDKRIINIVLGSLTRFSYLDRFELKVMKEGENDTSTI